MEAPNEISSRTAWQRVCLARAKNCLRLANQVAEWGPPFRAPAEESLCESTGLLRWGCLWLLAYETEMISAFDTVLQRAPSSVAVEAAGGEEEYALLQGMLQRGPLGDASLPLEQAHAEQDELRSFAVKLLAIREAPEREAQQRQRRAYGLAAAIAAIALVLGGFLYWRWEVATRGPNLAAGRPWRASSAFASCDPGHPGCGGAAARFFFHTQEEAFPWVEFDLGGPTWVRRVEVRNRLDCCGERAVPLAIEVSDDDVRWVEVARKDIPFDTWTARFPSVRASHVRLRVLRKSFLHLEDVAIR